ncbi:MAG: CotH kinase family protein, partial [Ruminococcus sp.]|nr:CotH kinase family protein [Ruminococcus sp.]
TDSLIEYFAMQIYWCNGDWPWNNVAVWRSKNIDNSNPYSDGKWRMLLFDTDFTTGLYKNTDTVYTADTFAKINGYDDNISRTFMRLLKNHDFRKEFCNVFMDLANYNFSPERTDSIIEDYREKYRQQIYDTNERFYASTFVQSNSVSRFDSEVDVIKDFYRNRFKYATDSLKRITGSGLLKKVTLRKNAHGSIQVNTITPDISEKDWCGQYFSDYGITLKAVADEGYKFEKWEITGTRVLKAETKLSKIVISPDDDVIVRAVFKKL